MTQIQDENRTNCWFIGTVDRAIYALPALSSQKSNFVSHIHSSDFSVHVHKAS